MNAEGIDIVDEAESFGTQQVCRTAAASKDIVLSVARSVKSDAQPVLMSALWLVMRAYIVDRCIVSLMAALVQGAVEAAEAWRWRWRRLVDIVVGCELSAISTGELRSRWLASQ
jgi:hypothetical protein